VEDERKPNNPPATCLTRGWDATGLFFIASVLTPMVNWTPLDVEICR